MACWDRARFLLHQAVLVQRIISLVDYVHVLFTNSGCNACYIGETSRHLSTRVNEHLTSDKSSHIYKHLSESLNYRLLNSPNSFKILDQASTEYELRIWVAYVNTKTCLF